MYAFRRIKIEVNIGSTTIVSLDPFPLAGDRFAIPSPRFMHDETTASIATFERSWGGIIYR